MSFSKISSLGIVFFLSSFLFNASGQNLDSITVKRHLLQMDELWKLGKYQEGLERNTKIINTLKHLDSSSLGNLYRNQGRFHMNSGNFDSIMPYALRAYALVGNGTHPTEKAKYLELIGKGYFRIRQMDSAKVYYLKTLKLKKEGGDTPLSIARTYYNLCTYSIKNSEPQEAKSYGEKGLKTMENEDNTDDLKADLYNALVGASFQLGDYTQAENYAKLAISKALEVYGEMHPKTVFVYASAAAIYGQLGQYDISIEYGNKSVEGIQTIFGPDNNYLVPSLINLAEAYSLAEDEKNSLVNLDKAIQIASKNGYKEGEVIVKTQTPYFLLKSSPSDPRIEPLLIDALQVNTELYGNIHDRNSFIHLNFARLYRENGDFDKALESLDKAVIATGFLDASNSQFYSNQPTFVMDALDLKSKILVEQYEATKNPAFLNQAFELVEKRLSFYQKVKKLLTSQESVIELQSRLNEFYEDMLSICFESGKERLEVPYNEVAFKLLELANSNTLFLSVMEGHLKKYAKIPDSIIKKEGENRQMMFQLQKSIAEMDAETTEVNTTVAELYEQLLTLQKSQDSITKLIAKSANSYQRIEEGFVQKGMEETLKNLSKNQQVIHYFLGKRNLYYLIISKTGLQFERQEVSEENLSNLQDFLLNVSSVSQNEAISKNLYKWLGLNQVDVNKNRLIVIPNGILGYLPFETLQNEKGEMLFEKFSISYAPSLRLVQQLSIDKRTNDKSWAGFLTNTDSEVSLDAANNEVAQLSYLLNGDVFQGNKASSISLFEAASSYDIIHLALHSKADANNPLFSKIYFDDEVINAADIYGSSISSKMVVLSSCESGSGQLKKGEGVMSLSRAFTYAGAASTVVSLWEVPDKETAKIMTLFYQHLKQGKAKDVALRDAKLEYLNTTDDALLKHPYYWAGFVVTGDTSPLYAKQTYSWWMIIGIGGLLLVGFIVYRKKRLVQAA